LQSNLYFFASNIFLLTFSCLCFSGSHLKFHAEGPGDKLLSKYHQTNKYVQTRFGYLVWKNCLPHWSSCSGRGREWGRKEKKETPFTAAGDSSKSVSEQAPLRCWNVNESWRDKTQTRWSTWGVVRHPFWSTSCPAVFLPCAGVWDRAVMMVASTGSLYR
jgi:hypothetical protein